MGDKAYALMGALVVMALVFMFMTPVFAQEAPPDENPPSEEPLPGPEHPATHETTPTETQTPGTTQTQTPGTTPEPQTPETPESQTPGTQPEPVGASAQSGTSASVSENIPASTGGTIILIISEPNVAVNVLVPPNALAENEYITLTQKPSENLPTYVMVSEIFDIGPNGTTFNTPSTITLPYDETKIPPGVSEDDLAIYRRASSGDNWERVGGTVNQATSTISAQIDHLSEYVVMAGVGTSWFQLFIIVIIVVAILAIAVTALWISWKHSEEEAKKKYAARKEWEISVIRALNYYGTCKT